MFKISSQYLTVAILGVLVFVIYTTTLCPTVTGGDSGELIVAAKELGVAHPPGYPLYTVLAHVFTWFPYGSVAWRVNLFSAVCNALAAVVLAFAVLRAKQNLFVAVMAAGLFAFSPLIWSYSTVAEVFALNNLFVSVLLLLSLSYSDDPTRKKAYLFAFVSGLALTNHQTIVFFAAPVCAWIYFNSKRFRDEPVLLSKAFLFFTLGLLPYLYLPLSSLNPGIANWGDQSSIVGFFRHLLRSEYGTLELARGRLDEGGGFFYRIYLFLKHAFTGMLGVGFILSILGLYRSMKSSAKERVPTRPTVYRTWAVALIFYVVVFTYLARIDINVAVSREILSRFWQQADVVLFFFAAVALSQLKIKNTLVSMFCVGIVLVQVSIHYQSQNRRHETVFAEYAQRVFNPLPSNGVLLTQGDHSFGVLRYFQTVEKLRPDVITLDLNYLSHSWSANWVTRHFKEIKLPAPNIYSKKGFNAADLIRDNPSRSFYFLQGLPAWDKSLFTDFEFWPVGLAEKAHPKTQSLEWADWATLNESFFQVKDWDFLKNYPEQHWAFAVRYEFAEAFMKYGARLIERGLKPGQSLDLVKQGIAHLESVRAFYPNPRPLYYKNLGIAYMTFEKTDANARKQMIANYEKYLSFGPKNDPSVPGIKAVLQRSVLHE